MKQIHHGRGISHLVRPKIAFLAALLAATGCVSTRESAPDGIALTEVQNVNVGDFGTQQLTNDMEFVARELPVERALAWGVLPGVYQQLGIPVANSNPQSFQVGNLGFEVQRVDGKRMNHFLDCGTSRGGPIANSHQVTLVVLTKLGEVSEERTEVSSVVDGSAVHRSTAGYPVACRSRETLEELIADRVAEALGVS
ncbi:MAG: hypothetical protein OXU64_08615 [Gemmatimonadota bacterium]|nr:hypothetical protein [Gemmatimonadota bacterium]